MGNAKSISQSQPETDDGSFTNELTDSDDNFNETKYLFPQFWPCRWVGRPNVPKDQTWPRKKEQFKSPKGYTGSRWVEEPQAFVYSQLPSSRFIRLIYLQPGQGDEPMICSLAIVNIDHAPKYEAISYVWGDKWEMAQLLVDGTPFRATFNLYAALESIRSPENEKILWADAICINQENYAERSVQVQMMREIYERASGVIVWLGPEDDKDEVAMTLINTLAAKYSLQHVTTTQDLRALADSIPLSSLPDVDSGEWNSLFYFFELPYFCRTWIIQEVQANENCMVICGKSRTTFSAIELAALCAFRAPEPIRDKMITDRGISNAVYIRSLAAPDASLMTRLEQTRGFFATDPRDKFFAFLRREDLVVPDYSKLLREVLVEMTKQILQEDGLDGLSYVVHNSLFYLRKRRRFLPSWTPTFSNCFVVPLCRIRGIAAGGPPHTHGFTVVKEKLKVKAILLDSITIVHPSLSWDDLSVTPSSRQVPTYVDRLWHLYSDQESSTLNYPAGSYSIQSAFSIVITAGLGRWGLPSELGVHEQLFSDFTHLLFERAGDRKLRSAIERYERDKPAVTADMDLIGDTIDHLKDQGGDKAGHEYEDRQKVEKYERMPAYQRFQRAAQSVCSGRCVFETRRGYLGLGPSVMENEYQASWDEEKGIYPEHRLDESTIYEIWLPLGAKTPFVLQPCDSSFLMVGECYLQGFMHGEAIDTGMGEVKEIEIV